MRLGRVGQSGASMILMVLVVASAGLAVAVSGLGLSQIRSQSALVALRKSNLDSLLRGCVEINLAFLRDNPAFLGSRTVAVESFDCTSIVAKPANWTLSVVMTDGDYSIEHDLTLSQLAPIPVIIDYQES